MALRPGALRPGSAAGSTADPVEPAAVGGDLGRGERASGAPPPRPGRRRPGGVRSTRRSQGGLLAAAWLALLAMAGAVVLWLTISAPETVERLRAEADQSALTATSLLPEVAQAPPPEPAPVPGPEQAVAPSAGARLPSDAAAPEDPPAIASGPLPQETEAAAVPAPAEAPPPDPVVAPPPDAIVAAVSGDPEAAQPTGPPEEAAAVPVEPASTPLPAAAAGPEPAPAEEPPPQPAQEATETAMAAAPAPAEAPPRPVPEAAAIPADLAELMSEPGPAGPLPTVAPDGTPPWQAFAAPHAATGGPTVALVVADLGLNAEVTEQALALPAPLTLAFSPYAPGAAEWIARARAAGHEALLQLPMEPEGFPNDDPGPETLLVSLAPRENIERLRRVMGQGLGYVGLADLTGSRFAGSADALRPVMAEVERRGLLWLDGGSADAPVSAQVAAEAGAPYLIAELTVGDVPTPGAVDARLAELADAAIRDGQAVAVVQPYPMVLDRLDAWLNGLAEGGPTLAPVSALAARASDGIDG